MVSVAQDGEHPTFCRLCEAFCGLVAEVEDGRVKSIKPDKANPHSQGHVCVKGMAVADLAYDPERILTPMKRVGGPGEFTPVSWEEALTDIAGRLGEILEKEGGDAFALYHGNPPGFSTDFVMATDPFLAALGAHKRYHAGSQDHHSRVVANYFVYGETFRTAFPDLVHCDFLMILGANPLVSNGSLVFAPRMRHDLDAIAERGRVIVVDPRLTETAKRYEHLPVKPNGDLWLLLGMLRVLIEENLIDTRVIEERTHDWEALKAAVLTVGLENAAALCGLSVETLRETAIAFGTTERAAIYGRIGICRGPSATFVNFLLTVLNIVAGKFGRRGGTIFGYHLLAGTEKGTEDSYDTGRSRIGDVQSVAGTLPCAMLPADLLEEGPGRIRAMFVVGANPVLSAPGGKELMRGLEDLDLMVSCDFYLNETHRYADYFLPTTTMLERADVPFHGLFSLMRPFVQYTEAVIEPVGESRNEYDIFVDVLQRLGKEMVIPRGLEIVDSMIRNGAAGDQFGTREGWSLDRLREHRHGVMVDLPDPTEGWEEKIGYPDRKFRLWHPVFDEELARAQEAFAKEPNDILKLICQRDIRSMNSWMHNIMRLSRSQTPKLLIHPKDATVRGIADGDLVRLWTSFGEVHVPAALSSDIVRGAVAYPHGWGHREGTAEWSIANAKGGENINLLLGIGPDAVERLAGMSLMDGLAVRAEKSVRNDPSQSPTWDGLLPLHDKR